MSADTKIYDVIVVGAGIGGLSAAARLVQAGLRVLVLEKSPHPGGTAYVYTRKGFKFPMGPLGFSSPKFVNKTLSDLDQPFDQPFQRVHYQIQAFGIDILLSQPFSSLAKDLTRSFPADAKGIKRFFQDLDQTLSAMLAPQAEKSQAILKGTESTPAKDYLESFITDWRLRRILGSLGTHEPYSSIPLMAAMWNLMSDEGIWYPPGGMRALADRLARAVTENNENKAGLGKIRLGVSVKTIDIENGEVSGVILKDGEHIRANNVISNADFKSTFLNLMKPGAVPGSLQKTISQAKQTGSVMQVCLGLDTSKIDLSAFSQASRLLIRSHTAETQPPSAEIDWKTQKINSSALAMQELELALMTREDRLLAPDGNTVLVIRTEANHAHFSQYRSAQRRRLAAYNDYKSDLGQALIREAAKLIPGLAEAVQVMDVATPLTFEDQGGRSQGAVAGWSWDFEDTAEFAPLELTRTPVRRLFMVGYQAYSALFMGGVPTAMESGRKAAEAVLQNMPPVGEMRIPGTL